VKSLPTKVVHVEITGFHFYRPTLTDKNGRVTSVLGDLAVF